MQLRVRSPIHAMDLIGPAACRLGLHLCLFFFPRAKSKKLQWHHDCGCGGGLSQWGIWSVGVRLHNDHHLLCISGGFVPITSSSSAGFAIRVGTYLSPFRKSHRYVCSFVLTGMCNM